MSELTGKDSFFQIISHEVVTQPFREFTYAVVDETRPLLLSVTQYIPRDTTPKDTDLTFICSPATGIPKEAYEPFFEDLTKLLKLQNIGVKAFWNADPIPFGKSAILNRGNIGNNLSPFDHSRDLLSVIHTFRSQISRPLIALGHSVGGTHLTWLAMMHPGLFEDLISLDPSILRDDWDSEKPAMMGNVMLRRREYWDSLSHAVAGIRKNPFYTGWDSRVLEKMIANQFVDITEAPSGEIQAAIASGKLQPKPGMVATATPRMSEFNNIHRRYPNADFVERLGEIDARFGEQAMRSGLTDMMPWTGTSGLAMFQYLPFIRPRVLYIVGENSDHSGPHVIEKRLKETGVAFGGSGGAAKGQVEQHIVKGGGHYDIFHVERSKELLKVIVKHLVDVHPSTVQKLKDVEVFKQADPQTQQMPDPKLVSSYQAWLTKRKSKM